jgi:hypothetical protein
MKKLFLLLLLFCSLQTQAQNSNYPNAINPYNGNLAKMQSNTEDLLYSIYLLQQQGTQATLTPPKSAVDSCVAVNNCSQKAVNVNLSCEDKVNLSEINTKLTTIYNFMQNKEDNPKRYLNVYEEIQLGGVSSYYNCKSLSFAWAYKDSQGNTVDNNSSVIITTDGGNITCYWGLAPSFTAPENDYIGGAEIDPKNYTGGLYVTAIGCHNIGFDTGYKCINAPNLCIPR